jgi:diacylglycerol kinase (ATP)
MKTVQLIHNPGAGDQEYNRSEILTLLKDNGYDCGYLSTKEDNKYDFSTDLDLLIIAGGDGTVRKTVEEILLGRLLDKPSMLAILPLGTANNISKALNSGKDLKTIIRSWQERKTKHFDVGRTWNVPGHNFFLESFGFGIFPYLMLEMEKTEQKDSNTAKENKDKALEVLHNIILTYEPHECKFEIDGTKYSGKFILAEIMNTPSFGPNLQLSPLSDPGDGEFELVLVSEKDKEKFAEYVLGKLAGKKIEYPFQKLKGKNFKISWEGTHVHSDDQIIRLEKCAEVNIQLRKGLLTFLVS